ncbi:hypothetical protein I553_1765 [Mycobacterium xenopi 4042]|uniref:Uncharacterized protein n=1 Tax=Mycobacterium xenopi 4042 TaxID=1299334 RepID=X8DIV5_MYCXE|nr:hypothetical protein I553_1765 [Mycobacterium xenopi 4042]
MRVERVDECLSDPPTPGGSAVPRANTTSTSGHGCADAGATGALIMAAPVVTATARSRRRTRTADLGRRAHRLCIDTTSFIAYPRIVWARSE